MGFQRVVGIFCWVAVWVQVAYAGPVEGRVEELEHGLMAMQQLETLVFEYDGVTQRVQENASQRDEAYSQMIVSQHLDRILIYRKETEALDRELEVLRERLRELDQQLETEGFLFSRAEESTFIFSAAFMDEPVFVPRESVASRVVHERLEEIRQEIEGRAEKFEPFSGVGVGLRKQPPSKQPSKKEQCVSFDEKVTIVSLPQEERALPTLYPMHDGYEQMRLQERSKHLKNWEFAVAKLPSQKALLQELVAAEQELNGFESHLQQVTPGTVLHSWLMAAWERVQSKVDYFKRLSEYAPKLHQVHQEIQKLKSHSPRKLSYDDMGGAGTLEDILGEWRNAAAALQQANPMAARY